jgi:hypothetical protein
VAEECPSARCTVTTSHPDAIRPLAQKCLRSYSVYPSSSAALRTCRHWWPAELRFSGAPALENNQSPGRTPVLREQGDELGRDVDDPLRPELRRDGLGRRVGLALQLASAVSRGPA